MYVRKSVRTSVCMKNNEELLMAAARVEISGNNFLETYFKFFLTLLKF